LEFGRKFLGKILTLIWAGFNLILPIRAKKGFGVWTSLHWGISGMGFGKKF